MSGPANETVAPEEVRPVHPMRHLPAFGLMSASYFAAIALFNPYAPLWFKELGFSTLAIGIIASIQAWTRVLAPYAWGWLGDHTGRRVELIRLASAGCVVSALSLAFVERFWPVALATAVLFVLNSSIMPLHESTLARLLTTRRGFNAARYGRVRMWGSVGFIASVVGSGALLEEAGVRAFPWLVAALNLVMLGVALRLPTLREAAVDEEAPPPVLPLLRQPEVAWFFGSAFFTVVGHSVLYAFFSLYLVGLGYGKGLIGALWALAAGVEILFFWLQGRWFDKLSLHRWLELVAGVSAIRFSLMTLATVFPWLVVPAQALHAISFAAHHASCIAMVHRLFPGRLRGRGQALYTVLGYGISGVVGGIGGGVIIEYLGFQAAFAAAMCTAIAAWYCTRRMARCAPATVSPEV